MNKTKSYCYQKYKSSSNNSCIIKEKNIVGKNLLEGTYFDGNGIPKMIGITKAEYLEYKKLQQENKQLKEELKAVRKGLNKVVSKRKKWKYRYDKEKMKNRRAKSYIKNNYHLNWYIESNYKDELLQILDKGESNE